MPSLRVSCRFIHVKSITPATSLHPSSPGAIPASLVGETLSGFLASSGFLGAMTPKNPLNNSASALSVPDVIVATW
jgi:hypothetical protein